MRRPAIAAASLAAVLAASLALALALPGCGGPPPLASCGDHLGGVWQTADGAARWHLLDGGARVEGYPLVRELPPAPAGTIAAPAVLDLRRSGHELSGVAARRWHRGADTCTVRAPARVRGCAGDRLALAVGDTGPPSDWSACTPGSAPATTQLLRRTWP
ncbi:MAG: hypothetical protein HS111_04910 [Kofleriaceae bacterium]|nr:hypothetical protein [Kofleriaceae bacterium]MCL4225780.1 hypothetical protein [Myxococcales bacterium]